MYDNYIEDLLQDEKNNGDYRDDIFSQYAIKI
jgi:hypothetical protein